MATILIKKRDTTGAPSAGDLTNSAGGAEVAVNTFDKRLFAKNSGGTVVELGTAPSTIDINAGSIDGTPIGANSASTGAFTTLSSSSTTTLNGTTVPASKTLLVSTDIGVTVQGYDADTAKYDDATANFTGTLQNGGSNVVVDTDIGSTVQGYDADTAKYDDATANFTGTLQNGGSNVVVDTDIGVTVQGYDADTAKYDDVTANFTGTLQNGGSNVVVDTDIGSTVQAYDADTAKYDDTTANFTGTLQNGGSNVLVDTDIGVNVQAYDAQLADVAGLTPADGSFIVGNGTNFVTEDGATARTSLGLGSISTQAADNVNIDGGAVDGVTLGTNSAVTEAQIDNVNINGNAIVSTNTDGNLSLTPNGTGNLVLDGLNWPQADGTADYVLKTDGSGQLAWAAQSGGGGTPGGSDTQIQYNSGGSFAGASGLVTDGSNLTLNAQGDLRFADSDSSNWVAFQAPATVASNVTWTLPDADGTNGQLLSTNGSGTLAWASGGGGGSSITAGDSSVAVTDSGTGKIEFTVDNVEVADFTTGAVVFNETGANQDFRVEGDTEANLLFVDAGNEMVGIGTNSPAARLHSETGLSSPALILQGNTAASSSSGTGTTIRFRGNANEGSPWEIFRDNGVTGDLVVAQDVTGTRTERARITIGGAFKCKSGTAGYWNATSTFHESTNSSETEPAHLFYSNNASFVNEHTSFIALRSANSAYSLIKCYSGDATDTEFNFRGDGNAYADGTFNNNGADYAEYFESANGQGLTLGATVVLDGNKVREATDQDPASAIFGVVRPKEPSKASMVIGNTAWNKWANKYLTDDFDRYIMEDHDVVEWTDEEGKEHSYESQAIPAGITVPADATRKTHDEKGNKFRHYKLNPAWNPDSEYVNRENRPEWNIIGLLGQVKILKGQPVGDRWFKMGDVSETVEEWFIR
jgi:hypothetical protein